jgi:hypothetical protein
MDQKRKKEVIHRPKGERGRGRTDLAVDRFLHVDPLPGTEREVGSRGWRGGGMQ